MIVMFYQFNSTLGLKYWLIYLDSIWKLKPLPVSPSPLYQANSFGWQLVIVHCLDPNHWKYVFTYWQGWSWQNSCFPTQSELERQTIFSRSSHWPSVHLEIETRIGKTLFKGWSKKIPKLSRNGLKFTTMKSWCYWTVSSPIHGVIRG